MDFPKNPHIFLRDEFSITQMIYGLSRENIRVVADFDSTMTAYNGTTSWSLFAESGLMPLEYVRERQNLKDTYYPYETDPRLPDLEKNEKMSEWWNAHLSLFRKYGLRKDTLEQIVTKEMRIRKGMDILFHALSERDIPVLILSAGIRQTIETVLRKHSLLTSNVSILSNQLDFDEDGVCVGTSGMVIHANNKNDFNNPHRESGIGRDRILLFGDSIGDLKMIHDSERSHTLAVGFCNSVDRERLDLFGDKFDIVIESDDSDEGFGKWVIENSTF